MTGIQAIIAGVILEALLLATYVIGDLDIYRRVGPSWVYPWTVRLAERLGIKCPREHRVVATP